MVQLGRQAVVQARGAVAQRGRAARLQHGHEPDLRHAARRVDTVHRDHGLAAGELPRQRIKRRPGTAHLGQYQQLAVRPLLKILNGS